jgi:hypothetical protein
MHRSSLLRRCVLGLAPLLTAAATACQAVPPLPPLPTVAAPQAGPAYSPVVINDGPEMTWQPGTIGGCPLFPSDNYWHADVSHLPVNTNSSTWLTTIGTGVGLKADFGSGLWDGSWIGVPYTTAPANQAKVPVSFDFSDESDAGPYPIPSNVPLEGGPNYVTGNDRHALVVQQGTCKLYETWSSTPNRDGSWSAGSGAVYDLNSDALRPAGWTSADAAGLPVLPGLVRYDEVAAGHIDHAIRFTISRTQAAYLWPARHKAGGGGATVAPMGAWLRLRSDVDISGFPAQDQVILRALQVHGMIVADNGSSMYMSGAPDDRWDNDALALLGRVKASSFEFVDPSSLMVNPDSGQIH